MSSCILILECLIVFVCFCHNFLISHPYFSIVLTSFVSWRKLRKVFWNLSMVALVLDIWWISCKSFKIFYWMSYIFEKYKIKPYLWGNDLLSRLSTLKFWKYSSQRIVNLINLLYLFFAHHLNELASCLEMLFSF